MKRPAYPKYKPSGIEWLGNVPSDWGVKRLKYVASINDEVLPETTSTDFEFRYVDIGSVDAVDGIKSVEEMVFENAPSRARRVVRNGDTIVSTVRTYLRAIAPIRELGSNLIVSTGFAVVRPRCIGARYLSYALRESSFVEKVVARSVGVSYPAVNASEVATISIPLPSPDEQDTIADYLDRETARIDALVAKKRELIEKLKEKRAALISRTVTRGLPPDAARAAGLDPNPKLKPSGVDWIGSVPVNWEVKPLKRGIQFVEGPGIMAVDFADDGIPLLRISGIGKRTATLDGCNYLLPERVEEKWAHFRVRIGDLLISGSASTGFCSEVDEVTVGAIPYTGIIIIRPRPNQTEKSFIRWYFLAEEFLTQAHLAKTGSTIQHFGPSHLSRMTIALPPLPEQIAIADYLDHETAELDALKEQVNAAIERLQEYRTALITAAVTGKIDVRNAA